MSPVALLVPGAGSCPATVELLMRPAIGADTRTLTVDARGGIDDMVDAVVEAVGGLRGSDDRLVLAAGVSLGAHALARWAATSGAEVDLLLVMPAWTGAPGTVAAATATAAESVERHGREAELARLRADPATSGDWVVEELARGWATYDDDTLVSSLRAASRSAGPDDAELRAVRGRVAVVALADDPLHPVEVARHWAATIPRATYAEVGRHEPSADRGVLGRAGRAALSGSR